MFLDLSFLFFSFLFFFFNDTATTEIYTLSLHDALPIYASFPEQSVPAPREVKEGAPYAVKTPLGWTLVGPDRKSTRLNSSH